MAVKKSTPSEVAGSETMPGRFLELMEPVGFSIEKPGVVLGYTPEN